MEFQEDLPKWDPADVFPAPDSNEINQVFVGTAEKSRQLARHLRNRIAELDFESLLEAIRQYEDCVAALQRVTSYAELFHGLHDQGPTAVALLSRCDSAWADVVADLGFFESELATRPEPDEEFQEYAHFVRKVRASTAQQPTGVLHEVLAQLAPTGVDGWQRLAQQLLNRVQVDIDGVACSIGAALPALYDTRREVRAAAHAAINRGLAPELELRATALNMVVADGEARAKLVGADWLESRHTVDQVKPAEISILLSVAEECHPVIHEYYEFKRGIVGLDHLTDFDRYAPLFDFGEPEAISWLAATEVVTEVFSNIRPELGRLARRTLSEAGVDAAPRVGKQRNASTRAIPGHLPCISMNYTGKVRDVLTLAHEMGHALHFQLAAERPLLAATPPPVLGETVALFCEAVTVRQLLADSSDPRHQAALLARWLEDQIVSIGRHAALHTFEVALRETLRDSGPLTADRIGQLWLDGQRRLYGPAVELTDGYAMWWSYITEFFTQPGSNYSYIYGQLSALALLARFEDDPEKFGPQFGDLLRAGDSDAPADLLAAVGVRTAEPEDWHRIAAGLGGQVARLRSLTAPDPTTSVPTA